MKTTTRAIIHIIIGFIALCIGVIGLILPILNGTLFIVMGLIIISFESPYIEKKLHHLTRKNAFAHKWHLKLEKTLKAFFRI